MYCKNCGFKNEDGSVFCANCGAGLDVEEKTMSLNENQAEYYDTQNYQAEQYVDIQSNYSEPVYNNDYYSTPIYEAEEYTPNATEEKINKTPGILSVIFGSVGIVLTVGVCCCYFIPYVGAICTIAGEILALALGITGTILSSGVRKKAKAAGTKVGVANAGFIVSIISIILPALFLLAIIAIVILATLGLVSLAGMGALDSYYYY